MIYKQDILAVSQIYKHHWCIEFRSQLRSTFSAICQDTENLMAQLAKDREAVDKVRAVVQREEDITDKEAKRVEAIAESARKDLEHAMPQLQTAIEMLDALSESCDSIRILFLCFNSFVLHRVPFICLNKGPKYNEMRQEIILYNIFIMFL